MLRDSRIDALTTIPADTPSGPAGSVEIVEFTLCGQSVLAIGAGTHDPFNDAISLHVTCEDHAEIDRYWEARSNAPPEAGSHCHIGFVVSASLTCALSGGRSRRRGGVRLTIHPAHAGGHRAARPTRPPAAVHS
jgi:3-demethylubiquinone-9 3-methyltransferase